MPMDVISAIQTQNVQAAVGRIGARPVSDDQQLQLNIQTKGRLSSPEEFEKIIIRSNPDGSVLRLGDIARLQLGAANLDRATCLNGTAATLIGIYQALARTRSGASTRSTSCWRTTRSRFRKA
jgi:multidrug efflux pump subunit AcrB